MSDRHSIRLEFHSHMGDKSVTSSIKVADDDDESEENKELIEGSPASFTKVIDVDTLINATTTSFKFRDKVTMPLFGKRTASKRSVTTLTFSKRCSIKKNTRKAAKRFRIKTAWRFRKSE